MKNNTMKRVLAGTLAVLTVAAYAPANVGGFLTGSTGIVANAEDAPVSYVQEDNAWLTCDTVTAPYIEGVYRITTDGGQSVYNPISGSISSDTSSKLVKDAEYVIRTTALVTGNYNNNDYLTKTDKDLNGEALPEGVYEYRIQSVGASNTITIAAQVANIDTTGVSQNVTITQNGKEVTIADGKYPVVVGYPAELTVTPNGDQTVKILTANDVNTTIKSQTKNDAGVVTMTFVVGQAPEENKSIKISWADYKPTLELTYDSTTGEIKATDVGFNKTVTDTVVGNYKFRYGTGTESAFENATTSGNAYVYAVGKEPLELTYNNLEYPVYKYTGEDTPDIKKGTEVLKDNGKYYTFTLNNEGKVGGRDEVSNNVDTTKFTEVMAPKYLPNVSFTPVTTKIGNVDFTYLEDDTKADTVYYKKNADGSYSDVPTFRFDLADGELSATFKAVTTIKPDSDVAQLKTTPFKIEREFTIVSKGVTDTGYVFKVTYPGDNAETQIDLGADEIHHVAWTGAEITPTVIPTASQDYYIVGTTTATDPGTYEMRIVPTTEAYNGGKEIVVKWAIGDTNCYVTRKNEIAQPASEASPESEKVLGNDFELSYRTSSVKAIESEITKQLNFVGSKDLTVVKYAKLDDPYITAAFDVSKAAGEKTLIVDGENMTWAKAFSDDDNAGIDNVTINNQDQIKQIHNAINQIKEATKNSNETEKVAYTNYTNALKTVEDAKKAVEEAEKDLKEAQAAGVDTTNAAQTLTEANNTLNTAKTSLGTAADNLLIAKAKEAVKGYDLQDVPKDETELKKLVTTLKALKEIVAPDIAKIAASDAVATVDNPTEGNKAAGQYVALTANNVANDGKSSAMLNKGNKVDLVPVIFEITPTNVQIIPAVTEIVYGDDIKLSELYKVIDADTKDKEEIGVPWKTAPKLSLGNGSGTVDAQSTIELDAGEYKYNVAAELLDNYNYNLDTASIQKVTFTVNPRDLSDMSFDTVRMPVGTEKKVKVTTLAIAEAANKLQNPAKFGIEDIYDTVNTNLVIGHKTNDLLLAGGYTTAKATEIGKVLEVSVRGTNNFTGTAKISWSVGGQDAGTAFSAYEAEFDAAKPRVMAKLDLNEVEGDIVEAGFYFSNNGKLTGEVTENTKNALKAELLNANNGKDPSKNPLNSKVVTFNAATVKKAQEGDGILTAEIANSSVEKQVYAMAYVKFANGEIAYDKIQKMNYYDMVMQAEGALEITKEDIIGTGKDGLKEGKNYVKLDVTRVNKEGYTVKRYGVAYNREDYFKNDNIVTEQKNADSWLTLDHETETKTVKIAELEADEVETKRGVNAYISNTATDGVGVKKVYAKAFIQIEDASGNTKTYYSNLADATYGGFTVDAANGNYKTDTNDTSKFIVDSKLKTQIEFYGYTDSAKKNWDRLAYSTGTKTYAQFWEDSKKIS